MRKRHAIVGGGAAFLALLIMVWNSAGTDPTQSATDHEVFDPSAAPKEAIQRAWRTGETSAFVQYSYTAPNACWHNGDKKSLSLSADSATLTLVPEIKDAFCAQAMTALTYDQELEIPAQIEVLIVIIEHPEGGLIERNELWIEPQNQ